jgi:hypothetical protein
MIQFQTQRTKLPPRSAAGWRHRINTVAFVASVALIAQILSACSSQSVPATSAMAQYPDLNDTPPRVALRDDQVAQIKADLIQVRDDQERSAVQQQALNTRLDRSGKVELVCGWSVCTGQVR